MNKQMLPQYVGMNQELISIPTKITDGIFMADSTISQDIEWLKINQVTHIINCAGSQCQNCSKVTGLSFLTFQWNENIIQNILDQNVINASYGFIEEAKKQGGSLLIHHNQSESRSFCILAAYFMIKFKWNLFKTLEFMNSRKEDIQLEPAFLEQLTTLHQKLQEKGLIKSRTWHNVPDMTAEEIILTNTYLNSHKKQNQQQKYKKQKKKTHKSIAWEKQIIVEHVYCQSSIISQLNNNNILNGKNLLTNLKNSRADSINSKRNDQENKTDKKINFIGKNFKQTVEDRKLGEGILSEMNVTKKWTQLREMWSKEKENCNINSIGNESVNKKQQSGYLLSKKDQRVNDRLQDKLEMLKASEHRRQTNSNKQNMQVRKKQQLTKQNINENKLQENHKKETVQRQQKYEIRNSDIKKNESKILHNNWIINSQVLKQAVHKSQKIQPNKSVIIVKPNHCNSHQDFNGTKTLRKISSSEKKEQNTNASGNIKFFKGQINDPILIPKGRSSSTKPQRKQTGFVASILKNSNSGKGKWKF